MKRPEVIKALVNYYKLEKFSPENLIEAYRSNREKYPSLNLDEVFKILAQPSERLSTASLEKNLHNKLRLIYSNLLAQKSQLEDQGKSCPDYISRFMKMIENLSGYPSIDESPIISTPRTINL